MLDRLLTTIDKRVERFVERQEGLQRAGMILFWAEILVLSAVVLWIEGWAVHEPSHSEDVFNRLVDVFGFATDHLSAERFPINCAVQRNTVAGFGIGVAFRAGPAASQGTREGIEGLGRWSFRTNTLELSRSETNSNRSRFGSFVERWCVLFRAKGFDLGLNMFIASGYGGQALQTLALLWESHPFERVTGYPLRSYVTVSFT